MHSLPHLVIVAVACMHGGNLTVFLNLAFQILPYSPFCDLPCWQSHVTGAIYCWSNLYTFTIKKTFIKLFKLIWGTYGIAQFLYCTRATWCVKTRMYHLKSVKLHCKIEFEKHSFLLCSVRLEQGISNRASYFQLPHNYHTYTVHSDTYVTNRHTAVHCNFITVPRL